MLRVSDQAATEQRCRRRPDRWRRRWSGRKWVWDGVQLPRWNEELFYSSYLKRLQGLATAEENNAFAQQLMILIDADMRRGRWESYLTKRGIEPQEIAQEVLQFICAKRDLKLRHDAPAVLTSAVHTTIRNRLVSLLRKYTAQAKAVPSSQLLDEDGQEQLLSVHASPIVHVEKLAVHLKEQEDRILGDAFRCAAAEGRNPHLHFLQLLYRYLCRQLFRRNTLLERRHLPTRLRQRVHNDDHAIITYRIIKAVHEWAEGH